MLSKRKQKFSEAVSFLLGLHPRCGAKSAVSLIGQHVARGIVQHIDEAYCLSGIDELPGHFGAAFWASFQPARYYNCHEYRFPIACDGRCVFGGIPVHYEWVSQAEVTFTDGKRNERKVRVRDVAADEHAGELEIAVAMTEVCGSNTIARRQRDIDDEGRVAWHRWKPAAETFPAGFSFVWEEAYMLMLVRRRDLLTAMYGAVAAIDLHSSDKSPRKLPAEWFMIALHEDLLDLTRECAQ